MTGAKNYLTTYVVGPSIRTWCQSSNSAASGLVLSAEVESAEKKVKPVESQMRALNLMHASIPLHSWRAQNYPVLPANPQS